MNRICPIVIDQCECIDPPVLNISSEAPDPLIFTGVGYSPYDPYAPPPLGNGLYIAYDCYGVAYSVESQELADLLAKMNAIVCQQTNMNSANSTAGGPWAYANDAQTAYLTCGTLGSSGVYSVYWYTVPAGTYVATISNPTDGAAWLVAANAAALAYANQQVHKLYTCIESPSLFGLGYWLCTDDHLVDDGIIIDFPFLLSGKNADAEYIFAVTTGALPPGLSLVQHDKNAAGLDGTPSTPGNYVFKIRATLVANPNIYAEVTNSIDVLGISTDSALSDAKVDHAYSLQLDGSVGTGAATYEFDDSNPAPSWLSISDGGLLSGTPDTVADYSFGVSIKDEKGHACTKQFTLSVTGPKFLAPFPPDGTQCAAAYDYQFVTAPAAVIFSGTVPGGLSMDASGHVTGIPSTKGSNTFYVSALDGDGNFNTFQPPQTGATINVAGDSSGYARAVEDLGSWSVYSVQDSGTPAPIISHNVVNGDGTVQIILPPNWITGTARIILDCPLTRCPAESDYDLTCDISVAYSYGSAPTTHTIKFYVCNQAVLNEVANQNSLSSNAVVSCNIGSDSASPHYTYLDVQLNIANGTSPVTCTVTIKIRPLTPP